jgi:mannose-6-phosphate isomerase
MKIIRTEKPWGYEKLWAQTPDYVGKVLFIKAGHRLSKQYHETKEETIYVVSGVLTVYDEKDNPFQVNPGENFHVVPGQVHRFGASFSNVELMEVSTNHLEDVVRLEDDYQRQ